MKRYRNREDESSLELLLDTMCNTFGGVMFIAIAIFVVASTTSLSSTSTPDNPVEDNAAMQKSIADLQALISDLQFNVTLRPTDPLPPATAQAQLPEEVVNLTRQLEKLQLKNSALQNVNNLADQQLQQTVRQQTRQDQQLAAQHEQLRQLQQDCAAIQQKITELQQDTSPRYRLTFKQIQPSSRTPFFIILHGTAAWPVGPWNSSDRQQELTQPDPAVSSTMQDALVTCRIKPQCGIEILQNNELSPQFSALLRRIPPERVPKFFIHPNSAATACRMREILKKQNILHGCTLAGNDQEPFQYLFTPEAHYEY